MNAKHIDVRMMAGIALGATLTFVAACGGPAPAPQPGQAEASGSAGQVLPFPPAPSGSIAGLTMQDSTYKKRVEPKRLAEGAPNILIILMDDVGPATPSTYGGEINTPTLDRIAKAGISYNRFHSTAMCSPTRAALLTGRNHTVSAMARSRRSPTTSTASAERSRRRQRTVAEVLKNYGYNTGAWGKWHNTPEEQITSKGRSSTGPPATASSTSTDSWPARRRSTSRP